MATMGGASRRRKPPDFSGAPFFITVLFIAIIATVRLTNDKSRPLHVLSHSPGKQGEDIIPSTLKHLNELKQCRLVHNVPDQCAFIKAQCQDEEAGIVSSLTLYYCHLAHLKPIALIIMTLWLSLLFQTTGIAASDFLCDNLVIIARACGLSETNLSVTLLAFGNGAPDIFSAFTAMETNSGSLAFGELLGAASFLTALVAGSIALVRPFKVTKRSFLADVVLLTLVVSFIFGIVIDGKLYMWQSVVMVSFYVFYVVAALVYDVYMQRRRRRREIEALVRQEYSNYIDDDNGSSLMYREEDTDTSFRRLIANSSWSDEAASILSYHGRGGYSRPVEYSDRRESEITSQDRIRSQDGAGPPTMPVRTGSRSSYNVPFMPADDDDTLRLDPSALHRGSSSQIRFFNHEQAEQGRRPSVSQGPVGGFSSAPPSPRPSSPLFLLADDDDDADSVRVASLRSSIFGLPEPSMSRLPFPRSDFSDDPVEEHRVVQVNVWQHRSVLPPPYIVYSQLFPTLQIWEEKTFWGKIAAIIAIPTFFFLKLTLPVIRDDRADDSGSMISSLQSRSLTHEGEGQEWHRWLLIIHVFTAPLFTVVIVWAQLPNANSHDLANWSIYSLVGSVVVLVLVLATTTNEQPPKWRIIISFLGVLVSITWISWATSELVGVIKALGVILDVSEALLGLSLFAVGNSRADFVATVNIARIGYPLLALFYCLYGPILNILLGIGISGVYEGFKHRGSNPSSPLGFEPIHIGVSKPLVICGVTVLLTLVSMLVLVPCRWWKMDRLVGFWLATLWFTSTTMNCVLEIIWF